MKSFIKYLLALSLAISASASFSAAYNDMVRAIGTGDNSTVANL